VVDRLNTSAREALQAPEVVTRFRELGAERVGSTPDELTALVAREIGVWSDVVRRSGVKAN
jgi:tripartite-type tricarboxylate transporter receptor subunit TctC